MSAVSQAAKDHRRAYQEAWCAENPRDRRVYFKEYRASNPDKTRKYREDNKELLKVKKADWYKANRRRVLARVKAYAEANKDQILAYHAEYYGANADKVKANVSAYRKANPDKKANLENRRRVRKANNGGSHTVQEWADKCAEFGNRCAYCREQKHMTRDHVVPLSRGGSDNIENIVPACRTCNSRKSARTDI